MTGAKGFTLMEILIVTLLFAIASTILAQTFVSFNKLQRRVESASSLSQDMRYATEMIVREARNKTINYDAYMPGEAASSTVLHLLTTGGTEDVSIQSGAVCADPTGANCLALSVNGGAWNPITSTHVNVRRFGVYIRPTSSPFTKVGGTYPSDLQPMVTFLLDMQYLGTNASDTVSLITQTSVASRLYQR
jgi:prepilin-type N-terminal cleavage/methylation domain-containing protein